MVKILDKIVDWSLDIFFSKDKTKLYVLLLFVLGFCLRLTSVFNLGTSVDASGHAIMAINFYESGKLATWNQSVGLWHLLTDFAYDLFGINDFGARFVTLIFGSFSIILMFLFAKEFFGKRAGLIASFLLAISPFHITETIPEMDVATMFFAMFSMFLFVRALRESKKVYFVLSGILLGVATLIKIYSVLFAPALIFYAAYYYRTHKPEKKQLKKNIVLFIIVVGVFCLVPISYNYLLYQDKGYLDYIFTGVLKLGEEKSAQYYSWIVPYSHDYYNFFLPGSDSRVPFFIYYLYAVGRIDPLIILLGILGLFLIIAFNRKNEYLGLLAFCFFTIYLYMGSIPFLMTKHYMFLLILLTPAAGFFVDKFFKSRRMIKVVVLILLIFQLVWISKVTNGGFYHKVAMNQIVSYKDNFKADDLVVYDARIFRGMGAFFFSGTNYLESSLFPELMQMQPNLSGNYVPMKVYFVECVADDCGWGTIKDQPEFNQSMEQIVDFFKADSSVVKKVYKCSLNEGSIFSCEQAEEYRIYLKEIPLKPVSIEVAEKTHIFWANPMGWDEKIAPVFDNYKTKGFFNGQIDNLAHLIFYLAAIFSVLSVPILLYFFIRNTEITEKNETEHNNSGV